MTIKMAAQAPAAITTVPSPKGRWKRRPSPRAPTSASTPSATSTSAASTNENGPKVLTIRSSAPTTATFCSKLTRRQMTMALRPVLRARAGASVIGEWLAAGEARVRFVPEGDLFLALLPAEIDLAAVADGREVHQATLEVAPHHLALAQLHQP